MHARDFFKPIVLILVTLSIIGCARQSDESLMSGLEVGNKVQLTEDQMRATVEEFFGNYSALSESFEAFKSLQSPLLAPSMVTYNRYRNQEFTYRNRSGYFESIEAWASVFSTEGEFGFDFESVRDNEVTVLIRTTVVANQGERFTNGGKPAHCWRETFRFDEMARITQLGVFMNLDRTCDEAENTMGLSPLMQASALGDLDTIKALVAKGVRLTLTNYEGASALYFAAQSVARGDQVVSFFKAHFSSDEFERLLNIRLVPNGHTVAFEATFNVNTKLVDYLLEQKKSDVRVNFKSPSVFGWTPRSFAERESMPFAHRLPVGELRVSERSSWLELQESNWLRGLSGEEKAFHERGLLLINAVARHDIASIEELVASGVSVNERYGRLAATPLNSASTPGMSAIEQERAAQTILCLLRLGADPNYSEGGIMKVPHGFREAVFGYVGVLDSTMSFLKSHSPEAVETYLNTQGPINGYTKLIDAALRGRQDVIKNLVAHGARLEIQGHNGITALEAARLYNSTSETPFSEDILEMLH